MPRTPASAEELLAVSARLRLTRAALGRTHAEMSALMDSTTTRGQAWENYESGRRRISLNHAITLARKCELTLDWIYLGNTRALRRPILRALQKQMRAQKRELSKQKPALDTPQDVG